MKLKEVCESTGLSRKTIRLYEEKGLLVPQMERRNGRDYREYSPEDVKRLQEIATLRRAWFTMDEIARMQQNPETIGEIFPQYLQWLEKQKTTLESLLKAAKDVDPSKIQSVSELSEKMREAETMPLPAADIEPKFQYLDALEQRPEKVEPDWQEPLPGGMDDSRIYRQFVAANSKDKSDDLGVAFGQLRDAMTPERESTPVVGKKEMPKTLQRLEKFGEGALILGAVWTALYTLYLVMTSGGYGYGRGLPVPFTIGISLIIVGSVGMGAAKGIAAYRERQAWIQRMREQDEEKQRKKAQE